MAAQDTSTRANLLTRKMERSIDNLPMQLYELMNLR